MFAKINIAAIIGDNSCLPELELGMGGCSVFSMVLLRLVLSKSIGFLKE